MNTQPILLAFALLLTAACRDAAPQPTPNAPPTHVALRNAPIAMDTLRATLARAKAANRDTQILLLQPLLETAPDAADPPLRDTLAEAYRVLGAAYFGKGVHATARRYYRRGLALAPGEELPSRLYCNMGLTYYMEKDYRQSISYLDSARQAGRHNPGSYHYFIATYYTGYNYQELEEYRFAASYFRQALAMAPELERNAQYWQATANSYLSNVQRYSGELAAAIEGSHRGLATLANPGSVAAGNLHLHIGNAWQDSLARLSAAAPVAHRTAAGDSALLHTRRAMAIYRRLKKVDAERTTALNLGELYRRLGQFDRSVQTMTPYIEVLENQVAPEPEDQALLGKLLINRGESHRDGGNTNAALRDFRAALAYLAPQNDSASSGVLPDLSGPIADPAALLILLQDLAEWYRHYAAKPEDGLRTALAIYDSALIVTERLRADFTTTEDKIALARRTRPLVDGALSAFRELTPLASQENLATRAFQLTERRKAILLLSHLRQDRFLQSAEPGQRTRLKTLQQRRAELNAAVYAAQPGSDQRHAALRAWADTTARLRSLREQLLAASPGWNKFAGRQSLLGMSELRRQALEDDQAILSYHYQPGRLHVFLLTANNLDWRTVELSPEFTTDLATLNDLLTTPHSHPELRERQLAYCTTAKRLYDQLFPDFGQPLPARLVIIPDAPFLTLPFEALWTRPEPGGILAGTDAGGFLLAQHAISYAYSANLLVTMRQPLSPATGSQNGTLAGFAARFPTELQAGGQVLLQPVSAALPYLQPLPGEREIERIAQTVRTQTYSGERANRDQFLKACSRHQAVHMVTHGILSEANPLFNFISFSQLSDTIDTDQLLFLEDLYAEGLEVDLVSLSACQTAQGEPVTDEGPMSLARGLAAAGVRSVVTHLWKVNPDDTKDLMPLFYAQFTEQGGMSRDLALTAAKRRFLQLSPNHRDPSVWASGILIGNSGSFELKAAGSGGKGWWVLPVGLGLIGLLYYRRKKA